MGMRSFCRCLVLKIPQRAVRRGNYSKWINLLCRPMLSFWGNKWPAKEVRSTYFLVASLDREAMRLEVNLYPFRRQQFSEEEIE